MYVLINEKGQGVQSFYTHDEAEFKRLNKLGWGVYQSVNDFEATLDEMKKAGASTTRNIQFLTKINAVFADLDVAKAGDKLTREEKEQKKETLLFELYGALPPSWTIDTSNGLQPFWCLLESSTEASYQSRYVRVINAIIEWSKKFGAMGDQVKDVTRVLRVPGYYHMKAEPYMVTQKYTEDIAYKLEELEAYFLPFSKREPEKLKPQVFQKNNTSQAIDSIDFQLLIQKAFGSIGRHAEFDPKGRLLLDGRLTGTFQGKKDQRDYLASTSHEPFEGNRITAVADILGVSNKEARAWIVEEFQIKKQEALRVLSTPRETKKVDLHYSWGTKELTENFAPIKRETYTIIGAATGIGKTAFCMHMAITNARMGHKVLYISLEMDNEELLDYLARKASKLTIAEEIYHQIPENKKELYEEKRRELEGMKNFQIRGVKGGTQLNFETLSGLMEGDYDLIFVDNFNLVERMPGMSQYDHEGWLSSQFLQFSAQKHIPLVVVHHFSKGGAQSEGMKTSYSLSGNAKIVNDAMRVVLLDRKRFSEDENPSQKERAKLKVVLDKGRGYDGGISKNVYFFKGEFFDYYPDEKPIFLQESL